MAFFGFGKKDGDNGDKGGDTGGDKGGDKPKPKGKGDDFKRDLRRGNRFIDHARTVSDASNYDYAIELYISGMRHMPSSMDLHEELHEVALKRKVTGGKPGKAKAIGASAVDKMLTAEKTWMHDPMNVKAMVKTMDAAVTADQAEADEDTNLAEIALWVGTMAIEFNSREKPDRGAYLKMIDLFEQIHAFDKAVEACKRALNLKEDDSLRQRLRDLEASRWSERANEAESSRDMLKSSDEQELIQAQLDTTGSRTDELIAAMRAAYEDTPDDLDLLQKLVDALLRSEKNEKDKEAIVLLMKAHEQSGQYRYKVKAGDIKIKQFNRALRALATKAKAGDENAKTKYQDGMKKRLIFELQEFGERVQNYPTDFKLKFELAKRQYQASQFDDAIGNFQQAKAEPTSRSQSYLFLGKCFVHKEWMDEAINMLAEGIEQHPINDDAVAKELRYDKMLVHSKNAQKNSDIEQAKLAQALASELLQADINYRDIRVKMEELRTLVKTLS